MSTAQAALATTFAATISTEVGGATVTAAGAETPDLWGAFPRLSDGQIAALSVDGERRPTRAGEVLYRVGDENCDFFVVLAGLVAIVDAHGGPDERVVAVHGPGRFLGELTTITGQPAFLSAVVHEPGEVLVVPVERLRRRALDDPALGDLILRAYLARRSLLIELGTGLRIVGSRFSPDSRRLREFAARNRLPHRFVDVERDPDAETLLQSLGVAPEETPVVIWRGREVLRHPSNAELARMIGLPALRPAQGVCDMVVVGAGPAGLAAAVYGASEGLATLVLDAEAAGGQAATSSRIENYLGFPLGISGAELAERAVIQAEKFGAMLSVPARAAALEEHEGHHVVRLEDGEAVAGRTVVVATGARYRRLRVPGLERFEGASVYYAATVVEAQMCANDPIAIVGGGNSAGQATVFLSRYARVVRLLVRSDDLGRSMSRYLVERIRRLPGVEVHDNTEVREVVGDGALEAVVVEDNRTGARSTLEARALFVFIGADPNARWLGDAVRLDEKGFVLTGADAIPPGQPGGVDGRRPRPLETSLPGVFAVGDVRSGSIKRVASAAGEGSMAVRLCHEHLEEVGGAAGREAPNDADRREAAAP
jgi:thioredoxin reductase (NADPH)